jgi:hypothetical protein
MRRVPQGRHIPAQALLLQDRPLTQTLKAAAVLARPEFFRTLHMLKQSASPVCVNCTNSAIVVLDSSSIISISDDCLTASVLVDLLRVPDACRRS